MTIRTLIAGNWKMHGRSTDSHELEAIAAAAATFSDIDVLICPPATLLSSARQVLGTAVALGGQDCHSNASGAHTGDVSAEMLADVGCSYVLVGHSERRADHRESDDMIRAKAQAAWRADLVAVICIGETIDQRKAGRTLAVLGDQLAGSVPDGANAANTVVAYEPVWAIGTGETPTVADVTAAHGFIRETLTARFGETEGPGMRLLYGGSVKPGNAAELLSAADVDGALVGGASLKATDFIAICEAARGA